MKALSKSYPTNLSNRQWQLINPLIPPAKPGGRPRTVDMRSILNAIFYLLVSGCAWAMLPGDFPPYKTVYHYFRKWRIEGCGSNSTTASDGWYGSKRDGILLPVQPFLTVKPGDYPQC